MASSPAILEHKKEPFLKALRRSGKVVPAARAVRISPDAIYDWLRADASFRRGFNQAKRERFDDETAQLSEALDLFLAIVRPIIPTELYPRIVAATNLTLSQRKFKEGSHSTVRTSSRKVRFPSFDVHPESANSGDFGNRVQGKNETGTVT